MSNVCPINCDCSEDDCAVGRAFVFGLTMGMTFSEGDEYGE